MQFALYGKMMLCPDLLLASFMKSSILCGEFLSCYKIGHWTSVPSELPSCLKSLFIPRPSQAYMKLRRWTIKTGCWINKYRFLCTPSRCAIASLLPGQGQAGMPQRAPPKPALPHLFPPQGLQRPTPLVLDPKPQTPLQPPPQPILQALPQGPLQALPQVHFQGLLRGGPWEPPLLVSPHRLSLPQPQAHQRPQEGRLSLLWIEQCAPSTPAAASPPTR